MSSSTAVADATPSQQTATSRTKAEVRAALAFALALTVFILAPAFLAAPYPGYELLHWGDVLDLATAVVVLPVAWLLLRGAGRDVPGAGVTVLFLAFAGLWASAQGMHLAANAIGHVVPERPDAAWRLTYDLDEVLSHYLWHAALLGWTGLIAWRSVAEGERGSVPSQGHLVGTLFAAALFGFTFFVMVVEGQTAPMALPVAATIALGVLLVARTSLLSRPAASMVAIGFVVALLLCLAWAGMNDWQLIEFSRAGIID